MMFVPFIFSPLQYVRAPILWCFYKGLDFVKRTHSAMITLEEYCNTSVSAFKAAGRPEAFDQALINANFLYHIPEDQDLCSKAIYRIPDDFLEPLIEEKGSVPDAFHYLLTKVDDRFLHFLDQIIIQIEKDYGEKIEGFINFQGVIPSLEAAARAHNIPVIHWELGCWRYPVYLNTVYWDLEDLYGGKSVETRWQRFCKEHEEEKFPLLSKQECLALLLRKDQLYLLDEYDREPKKQIGVALTYSRNVIYSSKSQMDDAEILLQASEVYGLENMLIRKHPGDPYGSQYPTYAAAMEQQARTTPEFILDCETVISLGSGTGMQALLFNRKAITLLPCPSYFASGHKIAGEGATADEKFISFFAFCYLVPLEYMMSPDYFRWRLTMPTEREIYLKHMEFYFEKKAFPKDLIYRCPGERLDTMLKLQCYQHKEIAALNQEKSKEIAALNQEKSKEIAALNKEIHAIHKSKSYRIGRTVTWLPRKVRGGIRCLKENGWKYTIHRFIEKLGSGN